MTLALIAVAWLLTYLLHSTILLGGAWLAARVGLVRSPVARDTLWKVCLAGGILTATVQSAFPDAQYKVHYWLPGVAQARDVAPGAVVTWHASAAPALPARATPSAAAAAAPSWTPVSGAPPSRAGSAARVSSFSSSQSTKVTGASFPRWPYLLLGLWVVGAAGFLARLVVWRVRLARQVGVRREIAAGSLAAMLESLCASAGVRRRIRLTTAAGLPGPVAMGWSEICLPSRALTALSPAEQRAVLAHELGHVVRQDPLWLCLAVACESVLFVQPLNRVARRRIQEAAEYLCDDWAVHQTGGSLMLAKCLAEVATWIEARPRAVPISGMAVNRSQLVERVHRLLEGSQPRAARGLRLAVPVAALALSTVAFAGPGVSPPCDLDQRQGPAAAPARAGAGWAGQQLVVQGGPHGWATVRDGTLLSFRYGYGPRISGQGALGIRRGGRAIELLDGQRLLVNGREVSGDDEVAVCESDSVRIVDRDGRTLWVIEPVRLSVDQMRVEEQTGLAGAEDLTRLKIGSLRSGLDTAGEVLDSMDPGDLAEASTAAAEAGLEVARDVRVEVLPHVADLALLGAKISAEVAPRLALIGSRIGSQIGAEVASGISCAFDDQDLCDQRGPGVGRGRGQGRGLLHADSSRNLVRPKGKTLLRRP